MKLRHHHRALLGLNIILSEHHHYKHVRHLLLRLFSFNRNCREHVKVVVDVSKYHLLCVCSQQ